MTDDNSKEFSESVEYTQTFVSQMVDLRAETSRAIEEAARRKVELEQVRAVTTNPGEVISQAATEYREAERQVLEATEAEIEAVAQFLRQGGGIHS